MTDKRQPYTLQLTPGIDDDLIEAIKGLAYGQRNQALKTALRIGLGLETAAPDIGNLTALADDLRWVKEALQDMPGWLDKRLSRLSVVSGNEKPSDGPRLSAEDQARLKEKMKKAAW